MAEHEACTLPVTSLSMKNADVHGRSCHFRPAGSRTVTKRQHARQLERMLILNGAKTSASGFSLKVSPWSAARQHS
ncbi:hypothetical protein M407DRAFT_173813 [Tulasnella calospora MUT 4182]|uniref:Uncharacterized protein n=1 Tax=Tulasnella calospora MUT 4182 TaxID=1051891 RepID=A0A0C3QP85_9AGAM|nr:hypothetical protein M407DRAFT_173813 [Tulasnella calospora MUT 4182]